MKEELFRQLAASLKEGGAILRGKKEPARSTTLEAPDANAVREKLGLNQNQFAAPSASVPARSRTGTKAIAAPKAPPAPSSASPSPIPRPCWRRCTGDVSSHPNASIRSAYTQTSLFAGSSDSTCGHNAARKR